MTDHQFPHHLLKLHEEAHGTELDGYGIQAWLEWEMEALLWRVPADISRRDLEELIERSAGKLGRKKHSPLHQCDHQQAFLFEDARSPGATTTRGWLRWSEVESHTEWDEA